MPSRCYHVFMWFSKLIPRSNYPMVWGNVMGPLVLYDNQKSCFVCKTVYIVFGLWLCKKSLKFLNSLSLHEELFWRCLFHCLNHCIKIPYTLCLHFKAKVLTVRIMSHESKWSSKAKLWHQLSLISRTRHLAAMAVFYFQVYNFVWTECNGLV